MSYTLSDFVHFYKRLDKMAKISLLSSTFFIGWLVLSPLVPSREIPDTVNQVSRVYSDNTKSYYMLVTEYLYVSIEEKTFDDLFHQEDKPLTLGISYLTSNGKYIKYEKNGKIQKVNISGVVNMDSALLVMVLILLLQGYALMMVHPVKDHLFYNSVLIFTALAEFLFLFKIHFLTNLYEQFKMFP